MTTGNAFFHRYSQFRSNTTGRNTIERNKRFGTDLVLRPEYRGRRLLNSFSYDSFWASEGARYTLPSPLCCLGLDFPVITSRITAHIRSAPTTVAFSAKLSRLSYGPMGIVEEPSTAPVSSESST